jgi:hypothetical protein
MGAVGGKGFEAVELGNAGSPMYINSVFFAEN